MKASCYEILIWCRLILVVPISLVLIYFKKTFPKFQIILHFFHFISYHLLQVFLNFILIHSSTHILNEKWFIFINYILIAFFFFVFITFFIIFIKIILLFIFWFFIWLFILRFWLIYDITHFFELVLLIKDFNFVIIIFWILRIIIFSQLFWRLLFVIFFWILRRIIHFTPISFFHAST